MGANHHNAASLALLVLLVTMSLAPTVGASDAGGAVQEAANEVREAAADAQAEARQEAEKQRAETERAAEEVKQEAQTTAAQAQDLALSVYAAAGALLVEAQRAIQDLIPDTDAILDRMGGPPPESNAGFRSQSEEYEIVRPSITAPLMWVTASASGLVVFFLAARRLLGLGALPLLSRIAHSDIYNNDARRTIHELVVHEPGQCLNELVGRTGYSRNAVSYHLFVLEKEEEIISVKDGKYRRYFTRNGKYVNGAKNVVAALRNETTLKLARVVLERPGSIQRDLCVELGATPSATCWHAKRLLDLGVIRKERVANTVKYYPGEAMSKYDLSDMGLPRIQAAPAPVPTV